MGLISPHVSERICFIIFEKNYMASWLRELTVSEGLLFFDTQREWYIFLAQLKFYIGGIENPLTLLSRHSELALISVSKYNFQIALFLILFEKAVLIKSDSLSFSIKNIRQKNLTEKHCNIFPELFAVLETQTWISVLSFPTPCAWKQSCMIY